MIPKGNAIAYQALKPAEFKVGDIVSDWVTNYIKDGKAERAAKLKALQERNAAIDDYFKEFKVESKEVDKYISTANYQLTQDVVNKLGELHYKAKNAETDYERNKNMVSARRLVDQYKYYQTELGGKQFADDIERVRSFALTGDAFDDSEQLRLMKAYEGNLWRMGITDDGDIRIYAKTGENVNDPEKDYSLSELKGMATGISQVDLLEDTKTRGKGLYSEMDSRAKLFMEEYANNPTGDRYKSAKEFVADKAGLDFDSKYGSFNANRPTTSIADLSSMEYGQFAIRNIGKIPETEEEHAQARQKYIDLMKARTVETRKDINEVSAYQRMKDDREWQLKMAREQREAMEAAARIARGSGGGSTGGGGGFTALNDSMVNKQDKVIVQIPNTKGGVKGVQMWAANTVSLPKVKGYPATENTFGLSFFTNKKGQEVPTVIMGAQAENGRFVYSKISASDFTNYVSKAGYDPVSVLNSLQKNKNAQNKYMSRVDDSKAIYNKVKIGYKAKENKDDEGDDR